MKLHGILSIGVVLAVIHVAHSIDCMFHGGRTYLYDDMVRNVNDFSTNLYQAASNDPSVGKSFISSPLSVAMVLLMTGFGARGSTAAELNRFLHSESLNECTVQTLTDQLNSYTNVEITLANRIFADNRINIKKEYQDSVEFAINSSGIQKLDFAQSSVAVNEINQWCDEQTKSKIKDLMALDDVDTTTALVLVNAIYFKGEWARQFSKLENLAPFYSADGSRKDVPIMNTSGEYRYGVLPEISATFVEIPYKSENPGDSVSMFVILPDKPDGLREIEKHIHEIPLKTLRSGNMTNLNIYMPLFKIESKVEFTDILQSMGMEEIFSDDANFSGMSEDSGLKISAITQKFFIEVNEKGSEVATATGETIVEPSWDNDEDFEYFVAKNSFLVLIATEDVILFSGRVTDPRP